LEEPRNGVREGALPATGLAYNPQDASRMKLKRDVLDGMEGTGTHLVIDGEMCNLEDGLSHGVPP